MCLLTPVNEDYVNEDDGFKHSLKNSNATGYDNISNNSELPKKFANIISKLLSHIFRKGNFHNVKKSL